MQMLTRGDEFNRLAAMLGTAERIRFLTPELDPRKPRLNRRAADSRHPSAAAATAPRLRRNATGLEPLCKLLDLYVVMVEELEESIGRAVSLSPRVHPGSIAAGR